MLQVNCLADGVLVEINLRDANFNGVMYVKGHSNDERCRQSVAVPETGIQVVDFKVQFGSCGLFHNDVSIFRFLKITRSKRLLTLPHPPPRPLFI
jgi:hypothetical protein